MRTLARFSESFSANYHYHTSAWRRSPPLLITTCRRVPAGTNGAVSVLGITASAMGGLFVSAVFVAVGIFSVDWDDGNWTSQLPIVPLGLAGV